MMAPQKKKKWDAKEANKKKDSAKFKYIPATPKAKIDEKFHTLNDDGTYTYHTNFKLITSIEELRELIPLCKDKFVAWDTETTGLTYFEDYIVGFSISLDSYSGYYIPIRHEQRHLIETEVYNLDKEGNIQYTKANKPRMKKVKEFTYTNGENNLDPKESLDILYEIIINSKRSIVQNAEFDLTMMKGEGYDITKIKFIDTLILSYIHDAEASGIFDLKNGSLHYLGRTVPKFKDVLGKEDNFRYISPEDAYFYACADSANTFGLFEFLYPQVKKSLAECSDVIEVKGKRYNVLAKDIKLTKCFTDYYSHCELTIDKEVAIEYKKKTIKDLEELSEQIFSYFNKGIFSLAPTAKVFKEAMEEAKINTGHETETGAKSYGKEGITFFFKQLRTLKDILSKSAEIDFENNSLNIRTNKTSLALANILDIYGKPYFILKSTNNTLDIFDKKGETLTKELLIEKLNILLEEENKKLDILKLIQKNSSLTKAINTYIEKLTLVDSCRMRYKLSTTKSSRFSSGNGSKSDKKKNNYFIDLNAQNLTKPKSAYYEATRSEAKGNILGWLFTLVTEEYAMANKDTLYIVEGSSPDINIRNTIIAPEGQYLISLDYAAEEARILANLSKDSKLLDAYAQGLDPHTTTAYGIWGEENYDKNKRKLAKAVNFAIQYARIGGGAKAIADAADISIEEAKDIILKYNETFFEAIQWKRKQVAKMYKDKGVVYNIFGRPRKLGSYLRLSDTMQDKGEANYMIARAEKGVISHIIQGSGGDLMRCVMLDLYDKYFKERNPEINFVSSVHDEITFRINKYQTLKYARELTDIMTFKIPNCPLLIETSLDLGYRYGQMFCFEFTDETRTELLPKRV